ncbi:MAG: glycosyltransferase family 87 protein [Roseiflexaceae bacterium]|nr:glycosyltransferase family 87 protein [Roseiflexaceae bacterium]
MFEFKRLNPEQRLIVLAVGFLVATLIVISQESGADFAQDYAAAWAWWHGIDPGTPTFLIFEACCPQDNVTGAYQTAHPPFATLLALPFGLLPFKAARAIWLMIGCIAVVLAWRCAQVDRALAAATAAMWVIGLSLGAFEPLVFLALAAALRLRSSRPEQSAILIGLAAAIKVYPGVLLLALFIGRRWKEGLLGVAAAIGATLVADRIIGGSALADWIAYIPWNVERYIDTAGNASLVRLGRLAFPDIPTSLASIVIVIALTLPVTLYLYRSADWRALLPVMTLGSPLVGPHYIALVGLAHPNRVAAFCLGIGGGISLLARTGLFPLSYETEALVVAPALAGLCIIWLDAVRRTIAQHRSTAQEKSALHVH